MATTLKLPSKAHRSFPDKLFLTQAEAIVFLGLSREGWRQLRLANLAPNPIQFKGTGLRWRRQDLIDWSQELPPTPLITDRRVQRCKEGVRRRCAQ